ncbi:hypothetical protein PVAP13_5KG170114 [Panicum virgatum]|uniref:Uncharacterized protein n=1 Tax=Panicum virgatum TaxID=38727 RepID=A0A8T0SHV0_PANVG|nr:hypothetical protein PVAP13_5KG170114 [Panicum virgatum]
MRGKARCQERANGEEGRARRRAAREEEASGGGASGARSRGVPRGRSDAPTARVSRNVMSGASASWARVGGGGVAGCGGARCRGRRRRRRRDVGGVGVVGGASAALGTVPPLAGRRRRGRRRGVRGVWQGRRRYRCAGGGTGEAAWVTRGSGRVCVLW